MIDERLYRLGIVIILSLFWIFVVVWALPEISAHVFLWIVPITLWNAVHLLFSLF